VLEAARAEFAERGYRDTTIDRIAARADLTRGAVYSNFPGKRALYLSTLIPADASTTAPTDRRAHRSTSVAEGLASFASSWLDHEHPDNDALPELADLGTAYAGLLTLNAVLLGLSLDEVEPGRLGHKIGIARLALTLLTGATQLGSTPGFSQPIAVARACAHLAGLELPDPWTGPPSTPPVRPVGDPFDTSSRLDGVVLVLGLNRLSAVEDAVRTCGAPITVALVSSTPDELGPLARYTTGTLLSCLRQSLPVPRIRLVHDDDGVLATSVGCEIIGDDLEYAASIDAGRIVARSEGHGAAAAIAGTASSVETSERPLPSR